MVKHESGPWEYDKEGRIFHRREPLLRYIIANMESADEANWMLVSAAPDLLEALEEMVDYCNLFPDSDCHVKARAAISKAKGE